MLPCNGKKFLTIQSLEMPKCGGNELARYFNFSSFLLSLLMLHCHKVCILIKGESKGNDLYEKHNGGNIQSFCREVLYSP